MKTNQKGFSVVEILVVVIVVAILGTVGWLAYDRQSKDKDSEPTSTVQNTETDHLNSRGFLTLTDFNAKIPLDDQTSGLKLGAASTSSYSEADKSMPIIAPQLDNAWKCEPNPNGNFKGTIGTISVTPQAKRSGPSEPLVSKKVGTYTFGYEQGGAACTDSPEYQTLVDAFKAQFEKIEAK